jgi:hypothetical protein
MSAGTALPARQKNQPKYPYHPYHPYENAFSLLNSTDLHNLIRLKTRSPIKIPIMSEAVRNAG